MLLLSSNRAGSARPGQALIFCWIEPGRFCWAGLGRAGWQHKATESLAAPAAAGGPAQAPLLSAAAELLHPHTVKGSGHCLAETH